LSRNQRKQRRSERGHEPQEPEIAGRDSSRKLTFEEGFLQGGEGLAVEVAFIAFKDGEADEGRTSHRSEAEGDPEG
jgi:hypothetical protein